ncbi:hypothetical protein [Rhizobium leguminosarum]|uniref:hypothetical protein n=1 Tax=Rhizobium leguminosarum TaxID=384 RepID=UPI00035E0DA5|nr:hypothetical protein [Rhizobium leguminosarum]
MAKVISPDQKKAIGEGLKNLKPGPLGDTGTQGSIDDFCGEWPRVRSALVFLSQLPGMTEDAKAAITKVIAVGDLASSIICN